jgi:benzodiazapine receptor
MAQHKTQFVEKVLEPIENMFHRATESTEHAADAAKHAASHAKENIKEAGYRVAHKLPENVQEKLGVKPEPLTTRNLYERVYDYFARTLFASPLAFIAAPLLVGLFISNWVQLTLRGSKRAVFERLDTPSWKPPQWLYDPMWTIALSCMGYASYKIYEHGGFGEWLGLGFYALNIALLVTWPFLFFGRFYNNQLFSALCATALLLNTLVTTLVFAAQSDTAALLMLPALAWIGYMCAVNWDIYNRNSGKMSALISESVAAKGKEETWPWGAQTQPQQPPLAAGGESKKVR